jgi:hypothetical protein
MPLETRLGECIDRGMVAPGDIGRSTGQAARKAGLVHREARRKPLEIGVNFLTIPPKVLRDNHTLGTGVL